MYPRIGLRDSRRLASRATPSCFPCVRASRSASPRCSALCGRNGALDAEHVELALDVAEDEIGAGHATSLSRVTRRRYRIPLRAASQSFRNAFASSPMSKKPAGLLITCGRIPSSVLHPYRLRGFVKNMRNGRSPLATPLKPCIEAPLPPAGAPLHRAAHCPLARAGGPCGTTSLSLD